MVQHVNNLCRSATFALSKIGKLRKYLDPVSTQKLIQAFVISRLDNCNSLLYGLSAKDICKIQRVQNMAAHLITLTKKRDHITPILRDQLHSLPVDQIIQFKILLLTYKAFHGVAPSYLKDLITLYVPYRSIAYGQVMCVLRATWSRLAQVLRPTVSGPLLSLPQRCGMLFLRGLVFSCPDLC